MLCLMFFLLKAAGLISWSWWWVISPIWFVIAIGFVIINIYLTCRVFKLLK
jgi:hypothetical protein